MQRHKDPHRMMAVLYPPTATPKHSAVESVWKDAKYSLFLQSTEALEDLMHVVLKYFRT